MLPVEFLRHEAHWNDIMSRVEMHIVATRDLFFDVAGRFFDMEVGESLHSENSRESGPHGGCMLLLAGGWTPVPA